MSVGRQRKEEKREKKLEREKERRRKIVNLVYLTEHQISIFYRQITLTFLGFHFETRNFVL